MLTSCARTQRGWPFAAAAAAGETRGESRRAAPLLLPLSLSLSPLSLSRWVSQWRRIPTGCFGAKILASPPPFPPFKGGVTFTTVLLRAKLIPQTLYLYVTPLVAAGMPVQPPRACQQAPKPSGHFSHSVLTKLFRSSHITTLWRIAHPLAASPVTTLSEGSTPLPVPLRYPGDP